MVKLKYIEQIRDSVVFPKDVTENKRHLSENEIAILKENGNTSSSEDWSNILVSDEKENTCSWLYWFNWLSDSGYCT